MYVRSKLVQIAGHIPDAATFRRIVPVEYHHDDGEGHGKGDDEIHPVDKLPEPVALKLIKGNKK